MCGKKLRKLGRIRGIEGFGPNATYLLSEVATIDCNGLGNFLKMSMDDVERSSKLETYTDCDSLHRIAEDSLPCETVVTLNVKKIICFHATHPVLFHPIC